MSPQVRFYFLGQPGGVKDIPQLRRRKPTGEIQSASQRCMCVTQKSHANLLAERPLLMMADGFDERRASVGSQQCLDDGSFCEAGILEGRPPDARFALQH